MAADHVWVFYQHWLLAHVPINRLKRLFATVCMLLHLTNGVKLCRRCAKLP